MRGTRSEYPGGFVGICSIGAFADGLEEVATRRMSLPADEAEFQCARLLREYQDHLRRIEADDED